MEENNHVKHHITPLSTYIKVAGALLLLTALTVITSRLNLGAFAAPVAFGIALVKAGLVMLWFMHLKYENLLNRLTFATAFFFLALLFGICFLDVFTRIKISGVL